MNLLSSAWQEKLALLARKDRLPHAWIFSGNTQAFALAAAEHFSTLLVGGSLPHPDVHIYFPEGKLRLHPLHQVHEMVQELFLPPYLAKRKVFLVQEAELMLPASANALLKGLEEPPPASFLLLVTSQKERILPTIRSRCLTFSVPDSEPSRLHPDVRAFVREMWTTHLAGNGGVSKLYWEKAGEFVAAEEGEDLRKARELLELLFLWYRDFFLLRTLGPAAPLTFEEDRGLLLQHLMRTPLFPLRLIRQWIEEAMVALQRSTRFSRCLETFFLKCAITD